MLEKKKKIIVAVLLASFLLIIPLQNAVGTKQKTYYYPNFISLPPQEIQSLAQYVEHSQQFIKAENGSSYSFYGAGYDYNLKTLEIVYVQLIFIKWDVNSTCWFDQVHEQLNVHVSLGNPPVIADIQHIGPVRPSLAPPITPSNAAQVYEELGCPSMAQNVTRAP